MQMRQSRSRLMALLLAGLMLFSSLTVLAGCADSEGDATATETGSGVQSGSSAEDETKAAPYTNLEKKKYNREFVILGRGDMKTDFEAISTESKGSLLNELLVERNTVVAEDFGIQFVYFYENSYDEVNARVSQQALNSLDDYDVAMGHKYTVTSCLVNNHLTDLSTVDTLALTENWWDQGCRSSLTVNGKLFLMTGDVLPSSMLISACFAFNKRLMKELNKTEPYSLVREGKWTLDEFNAMTKDVTVDVDGDGVIDYKKDRYGLSSWMMDVPFSMFYGAGGMFGSVTEDGTLEMSFEDEDVINRYEKIYRAIIEQNAYFVTDLSQYETSFEMFAAGHALFYDTSLNKVRNFLADMSDDYGIVPVPKYDTNQKEYLSFVNGSTGFVMMVSTEKDPEYVGAILEAMARYNYENVSTKMFEIVTKLQSVRDQDSSEMVEYIIRNRVFDSAYFFDLAVSNVVLEQLKTGKPEISAKLTSAKKTSTTELKRILRTMSKKQK